ncbi:hypothetical protein GCM10010329_80090 [Streptomyces spiroverticillatus]|nr:hypothetical protein GCM10010329_80090 [Streptomyces spiroverticillatus]
MYISFKVLSTHLTGKDFDQKSRSVRPVEVRERDLPSKPDGLPAPPRAPRLPGLTGAP